MSRRNRVTPFSTFDAVPEKGMMMGNRGDLHAADGSISTRSFKIKAWISCVLARPGGGRVNFDTPGHYTPLFFLDEATALSAGHRPCAFCRRPAYKAFQAVWVDAGLGVARAPVMDGLLHDARIERGRQRVFRSRFSDLPDFAFITRDNHPGVALLVKGGAIRRWSHARYGSPEAISGEEQVTVLTPAPIVAVLKAGYRPIHHSSAE